MKRLALCLAAATTACSALPARQPTMDAAVAKAISKEYALESPPVFVSDPAHCTAPTFSHVATIRVDALKDPAFSERYPQGAFVLCDVSESRDTATAHYQRLLFHGALKEVKVAEHGEVTLRHQRDGWRVVAWKRASVDY